MSFKSRDGEADSLSQLLSEREYLCSIFFHLVLFISVFVGFFAKLMGEWEEKNNLILSKHLYF